MLSMPHLQGSQQRCDGRIRRLVGRKGPHVWRESPYQDAFHAFSCGYDVSAKRDAAIRWCSRLRYSRRCSYYRLCLRSLGCQLAVRRGCHRECFLGENAGSHGRFDQDVLHVVATKTDILVLFDCSEKSEWTLPTWAQPKSQSLPMLPSQSFCP